MSITGNFQVSGIPRLEKLYSLLIALSKALRFGTFLSQFVLVAVLLRLWFPKVSQKFPQTRLIKLVLSIPLDRNR